MNECLACHVDYYHNPDVRVLFSVVCDHRVCEPCIARLFQHGRTYPCPACGQGIRAEDFSERTREARQVDSEVKIRRQICDIYCKTREDFLTEEDYNDYLMRREDTIDRLVSPSSQDEVQEVWRHIDQYRKQNAEHILRVQRAQPKKKLQRISSIIEEEGRFCSSVNAEWGEQLGPGVLAHPLQAQCHSLLSSLPQGPGAGIEEVAPCAAAVSPFAPQPLLGEHGPADMGRQMSGGGQSPDACLKKARHFFFSDLIAATSAGA
mmetsp:Transcript_60727/g.141524  ORF Transcript_60727/g.141524 Transcript_60727/m.141524 type:complete len:263 (+) Transcript_60727:109-897(+)